MWLIVRRWGTPALVVAIWAVAAYTRLTYLDMVEFKGDEAAVSQLSMWLAEGVHFPLVGIVSSVGVTNPPVFIYLMAIP